MSSYDTGEAKEDDAVQCDLELPTEDGLKVDLSQPEKAVAQQKNENDICNCSAEALVLHNDEPEPQVNLQKQDSSQSIRSESRKVSFPKDAELVTGYLEPVNPWAESKYKAKLGQTSLNLYESFFF